MTGFLYSRLDGDNKTIYEMVVGFIDKHGFSSVGVVVGVTLRVGEITDVYKVAKYNSFCEKYHTKAARQAALDIKKDLLGCVKL